MAGVGKIAVIATLGLAPAIVTEMVDALAERGKLIDAVYVVTSKGAELSYHVLNVDFRHGRYGGRIKLKYYPVELEDIISVNDVRTFRVRFQDSIKDAMRHYSREDIYINLAGGRKTMPVDAYALAMANGIENVYHVVMPGLPGVDNVRVRFNGREQEIVAVSEGREEPSQALLRELEMYLHPRPEEVSLVRAPVPRLTPEERASLLKELLA